jgi:diguanylate cyclase (GGDEF)-like protein
MKGIVSPRPVALTRPGRARNLMPMPVPSRPSPAPAAPRLLQELADTVQRARLGGPFYVVGWAVVWLASPTAQAHSAASALLAALFVAGMVLRFASSARPPTDDIGAQRRIDRVWRLVGATTAAWGGASAWILLQTAEVGAHLVVLICTIAFATAIAHSFCMRQRRALLVLGLLYLPVLGTMLLARHAAAGAAAIAVYLVYLLLLLRRSHSEYRQRLELEDDLRRQRDRFEQQSQRDGLTGLANRRRFEAELARLVDAAASRPTSFALLLFDLDHFKSVNDRHGHAVGDACLREFAERLQRSFGGAQELVARLGGEEFAVLVDGADEDAAAARGESFRQAVAGTPLVRRDLAIGLTVSIGVGAFGPRHAGDGERFFAAVDQALYRAKASGRNTLCRVDADAG